MWLRRNRALVYGGPSYEVWKFIAFAHRMRLEEVLVVGKGNKLTQLTDDPMLF